MPRPQSPLTKFILTFPFELPAAEVVNKAKAAGLTTNPENVTQVRSRARAAAKKGSKSAAAKKSAPKPVAAKKTSPKKVAPQTPAASEATEKKAAPAAPRATPIVSRSDFIRSLPVTTPVAEVVARGKAAGFEIRPHLVYEVRRSARLGAKGATKPAKVVAKPAKATPAKAPDKAPTKAPAKAAAPAQPAVGHASSRLSSEDLLRAVAAEVGLARAIGILEEQRRQVLRVLGG